MCSDAGALVLRLWRMHAMDAGHEHGVFQIACMPLVPHCAQGVSPQGQVQPAMSFVGGKLKLKGGDVPGIKKKKKKSNSGTALALANAAADGEGIAAKSKEGSPGADELKKVG